MAMELINGFQCYNCTDVAYAKRNIDPAHPKDGPYGVNAKDEPKGAQWGEAVKLGGALARLEDVRGGEPRANPDQANVPARLDLKV